MITTCVFNTLDRTNVTVGGESTTDEMCYNFVYYYPAQVHAPKNACSQPIDYWNGSGAGSPLSSSSHIDTLTRGCYQP